VQRRGLHAQVDGGPLALVLVLYVRVRGKALVAFFQAQDESIARVSERTLFSIMLASFAGDSLFLGPLSGLVYSRLGRPIFWHVASGAAGPLNLLALVARTPLKADEIAWNLTSGRVLGLLVPILAG
jgi:hypothetical protein